jgi:peptidoglycan-N-acetylglucosamine deacetylase
MTVRKKYFFALALLPALYGRTQSTNGQSQPADGWNHKQCAVVLTYDDAIVQDLDNVLPALDSMGLQGTFYLIGRSPVIAQRLEEWRAAARNGHELGNHSQTHPCDGTLPGFSSWVDPDRDLSKYTIPRAQDEIRVTNVLLQAIDGKTIRTFAFPCGEFTIHDSSYYLGLRKEFAGARGVLPHLETHTLLVFVFHGVGGGHSINVNLAAHSQLLHYLKEHSTDIWVAPMVDVATYIRVHQGLL